MAIRISGMMSGLDTDSIVKDLTSAYSAKKDTYIKAQKLNTIKQDQWKEINKKVYGFYTGSLSTARIQGNLKTNSFVSSDSAIVSNVNSKKEANIRVQQLATKSYLSGSKIHTEDWPIGQDASFEISMGGRDHTIDITADMTIKDVAKKLADVGLESNFDEKTGRLFLASKVAGTGSNFSISGDQELLNKMGLGEGAAYAEGSDAKVFINGAEFIQDNNKFDVNGIQFTAAGVGAAHIAAAADNKIFDTIKKLVEDYNGIVKDIDTRYNAASIKGYDPLTEDEESALSDKEVEKWNNKINEGCLRRDSTLGKLADILHRGMQGSFEINGKKYSLASMGITTNGYFSKDSNEKYCLTIDEDKLKNFINNNEDVAIGVISSAANKMYDELGKRMKSTSLNSAYSVYNDKQMEKENNGYNSLIKKWEDKVAAVEDKYYKQFAAMEKMLASLQNNSSSLAGLFG